MGDLIYLQTIKPLVTEYLYDCCAIYVFVIITSDWYWHRLWSIFGSLTFGPFALVSFFCTPSAFLRVLSFAALFDKNLIFAAF